MGPSMSLNAFVGMARAVSRNKKVRETLLTIQNHFYLISSDLALPGKDRRLLKEEIGQKEVDWLSQLSTDFRILSKPETLNSSSTGKPSHRVCWMWRGPFHGGRNGSWQR